MEPPPDNMSRTGDKSSLGGHLLAIGGGYVARALARVLLTSGFQVSATTRTAEKKRALRALGIHPLIWAPPAQGGLAQGELADLSERDQITHILISTPPDAGSCPAARLAPLLASLPARRLVIYLSSSAVYGDHSGGWVDERSAIRPTGVRGLARLNAEQFWQGWGRMTDTPVQIHRLSGIYGPGRNALATLRRRNRLNDPNIGQRIFKKGQVFNRIHLDDIVQVLRRCILASPPQRAHDTISREAEIFNHADDLPAAPQDIIAFAAALLNLPPPPLIPFERATLSAMQRSFYTDNKRIHNTKIKTLLGGRLDFPTYKEGLEALVKSDTV